MFLQLEYLRYQTVHVNEVTVQSFFLAYQVRWHETMVQPYGWHGDSLDGETPCIWSVTARMSVFNEFVEY